MRAGFLRLHGHRRLDGCKRPGHRGGEATFANSLLHTRPFVKTLGLPGLRREMSMPLVCCWAVRFGGNAEAVHVTSVCTVCLLKNPTG